MKMGIAAALSLLTAYEAAAQSLQPRDGWEVAVGVMLHDQSPFADHHEEGRDLNAEVMFPRPGWEGWQYLLDPRPHLGVNANLDGDTSYLYGGLTWEMEPFDRFLAAASLGLALHNGPLHTSEEDCRRGDCGFGTRASIRLAAELGVRLDERNAVTLLIDHISHAGWFADENEGVDNIGIRWRRAL